MSIVLVSVIISAYNAEKHLEQTILSVLNQTWPHLEIIIVNDGSTDTTLSIAQRFAEKGVIVLSQENRGQDAALNYGFKKSNGSYIKFMDSDDLINPEMIELQVQTLNGSKEYVGYGEWARFLDNDPSMAEFIPLSYWKDMAPLDFITAEPEGVMLQCGIMLVPRELIISAGLWDERLILFNDTEFFNRVILASKGVKFTKGAQLYYRSGLPKSISSGKERRFYESTFLATNLMAIQLMNIEKSHRVKKLVFNMYMNQYGQFYPKFPDLAQLYEKEITALGKYKPVRKGGKVYQLLSAVFGWKIAKRLQIFLHRIGYHRVFKIDPKLIIKHTN